MSKQLFILLGIFFSAFALQAQEVVEYKQAPEIQIRSWAQGFILGEKPFEGKTVILDFWATHCGPCIKSIPHMNTLVNEFASSDVVFASISPEGKDLVTPFLDRFPMLSHVVLDDRNRTHDDFGVVILPEVFVIDKEGWIRWKGHPQDLTAEKLRKFFAEDFISMKTKNLKGKKLKLYNFEVSTAKNSQKSFKSMSIGDHTTLHYERMVVEDILRHLLDQLGYKDLRIIGKPPVELINFDLAFKNTLDKKVMLEDAATRLGVLYGFSVEDVSQRKQYFTLSVNDKKKFFQSQKKSSVIPAKPGFSTVLGKSLLELAYQMKPILEGEISIKGDLLEGDFSILTPTDVELSADFLQANYGLLLEKQIANEYIKTINFNTSLTKK